MHSVAKILRITTPCVIKRRKFVIKSRLFLIQCRLFVIKSRYFSQKNVKISQKNLTGTERGKLLSGRKQLGTEITHIGCDSIQIKSEMKENVHVAQEKKLLAFTQNHVATR